MKKVKTFPSFDEENILWDRGIEYVVGIDEVGRGAFAGPLVIAAVAFTKDILSIHKTHREFAQINDSKLLTKEKRKKLSHLIHTVSPFCIIKEIPLSLIDSLGIHKACHSGFWQTIMAMEEKILPASFFTLLDGLPIPPHVSFSEKGQKAIIKGDSKSYTIAAASIIAKVYRDTLMETLPKRYDQYGFSQNKGYGTRFHRDAIKQYGLSDLHRNSFDIFQYTS